MPLVSQPNRGYADYQRISDFDSGALWSVDTGITLASVDSPVLDLSRWAYLGGSLQCLQAACNVQIAWYLDAAHTIQVGTRAFQISTNIIKPAQLRLPNLAPFGLITLNAVGGVAFRVLVRLFGTNRVHPLEFIPSAPMLMDAENIASATSSAVIEFPQDYYSGPVMCDFAPSVGMWLTFDSFDNAGVWDRFYLQSVAGGAEVTPIVVAPPGVWRAQVVNQGAGAGTFSLRIVPSSTGAT